MTYFSRTNKKISSHDFQLEKTTLINNWKKFMNFFYSRQLSPFFLKIWALLKFPDFSSGKVENLVIFFAKKVFIEEINEKFQTLSIFTIFLIFSVKLKTSKWMDRNFSQTWNRRPSHFHHSVEKISLRRMKFTQSCLYVNYERGWKKTICLVFLLLSYIFSSLFGIERYSTACYFFFGCFFSPFQYESTKRAFLVLSLLLSNIRKMVIRPR